MDWHIALDATQKTLTADGTRANSRPIYIPPGKVALLSMFNMVTSYAIQDGITGEPTTDKDRAVIVSDDCAIIVKLSAKQFQEKLPEYDTCNLPKNLTGILQAQLSNRKLFSEPVYQQGQEWGITPCNNFVLIPTPGLYMVQLLDPQQLDVAFIEYALLDVKDAAVIPSEFILGSGGCSGCI